MGGGGFAANSRGIQITLVGNLHLHSSPVLFPTPSPSPVKHDETSRVDAFHADQLNPSRYSWSVSSGGTPFGKCLKVSQKETPERPHVFETNPPWPEPLRHEEQHFRGPVKCTEANREAACHWARDGRHVGCFAVARLRQPELAKRIRRF